MTAEKTILKCTHCSKEFKYDSEKRRHEQSHFPQFQCKVCSKNFSFISALRRHEKQHERTGTVTCEECGREFRDHVLLKRHTKYAHGGSYNCAKCDTVFNSEPALRTHMQTHKSESERRYQCSFGGCTKKFNFAHHLKHHELTHTGSKQHYCKICGKGFIQSHHLKTHLKTHNADSSLYCSFPDCNKKFATEYAKKRHENKCHVKMDSGISSDSNSAHDALVTAILNDDTDDGNILSHEDIICKTDEDRFMSTETEEFLDHMPEDLSLGSTKCKENMLECTNKVGSVINNCKLAIGSCIMSEQGDNCVCSQINQNSNDGYDFAPIETDNIIKLSMNVSDCKISQCCGGHCDENATNSDVPQIEYKTDGTVKIKEFLDLDYPIFGQRNNAKFVPYNSCKAVLGNCIVSGNSTIGDGCLCARMVIDEQVAAEEIDDITPHPQRDSSIED